jgi:hypothetical protein
MDFESAQADMRQAYVSGSTGLAASSIAWFAACVTSLIGSPRDAIAALFIGGMLIFPVSVVFSKLAGRTGTHSKGNPLAGLAIETTIWMCLSIPILIFAFWQRPGMFFAAMMVIIGGRYLTFATLYGMRIYWICGGLLVVAAMVLVTLGASATTAAFSGAVIELAFAMMVFKTVPGRETGITLKKGDRSI